jgi:hypothetical protein
MSKLNGIAGVNTGMFTRRGSTGRKLTGATSREIRRATARKRKKENNKIKSHNEG